MELAIINGTYRDGSKLQQKMQQILLPGGGAINVAPNGLTNGAATPNGLAAAILASQQQQQQTSNGLLSGMGISMGNLGAIGAIGGLGGLTTVTKNKIHFLILILNDLLKKISENFKENLSILFFLKSF